MDNPSVLPLTSEPLTPDRLSYQSNLPLPHTDQDAESSSTTKSVQANTQISTIADPPTPKIGLCSVLNPRIPHERSQIILKRAHTLNSRREVAGLKGLNRSAVGAGSIGRIGQKFTVVNVGNKGIIYLGPAINSTNRGEPHQPESTFPAAPPASFPPPPPPPPPPLDVATSWTQSDDDPTVYSFSNSSRADSTTTFQTRPRSKSCSLINPQSNYENDRSSTRLKIPDVKDRSSPTNPGLPTLEISIPSYKLGSPGFNSVGSAYLLTSSLSSNADFNQGMNSSLFNLQSPTKLVTAPLPDTPSQPPLNAVSRLIPGSPQPQAPPPSRPTISPEVYNELNWMPLCDNPSLVRYSKENRIRAATPARLVVEITSPKIVDYGLLSDFFLTFRSYLSTSDLMHMLIARLKWALLRTDATGTVVRVRTFVAIRHWIQTYFVDDFLTNEELRKSFCDSVNQLYQPNTEILPQSKVHFKILVELKNCWRKICATRWKISDFAPCSDMMVPIVPGELVDSENICLDSGFGKGGPNKYRKSGTLIQPDSVDSGITRRSQNIAGYTCPVHHPDFIILSAMRGDASSWNDLAPSPTSIKSEELVPSFLTSSSKTAKHSPQLDKLASLEIPGNWDEKRPLGPQQNTSLADFPRDGQRSSLPAQTGHLESQIIYAKFPYVGSLIGGNLSAIDQSLIEYLDKNLSTADSKAMAPCSVTPTNQKEVGPGVKRSISCALRVLCNRKGQMVTSSNSSGCFSHIPPLCFKRSSASRSPEISPISEARSEVRSLKFPMRFDLLGAEGANASTFVVEEDEASEVKHSSANNRWSVRNNSGNLELQDIIHSPDEKMSTSPPILGSNATSLSIPGISVNPDYLSANPLGFSYIQSSGGPTPPDTPPNLPPGVSHYNSHPTAVELNRQASVLKSAPHVIDSYRLTENNETPRHSGEAISDLRFSSETGIFGLQNSLSRDRTTQRTSECSVGGTQSTGKDELQEPEQISDLITMPHMVRSLRRRPGCYLRSTNNIEDTKAGLHRRPALTEFGSTVSIGSARDSQQSSESICTSVNGIDIVDEVSVMTDPASPNLQTLETRPRSSIFSLGRSQHGIPLPFLKEAQLLAQIPDDDDDDGGVESALLKLEGKFKRRHSGSLRLSVSATDLSPLEENGDGSVRSTLLKPNQIRKSGEEEKVGLAFCQPDRIMLPATTTQVDLLNTSTVFQSSNMLSIPGQNSVSDNQLLSDKSCASGSQTSNDCVRKYDLEPPRKLSFDGSHLYIESEDDSDVFSRVSQGDLLPTKNLELGLDTMDGNTFPPMRAGTVVKEHVQPPSNPLSPSLTTVEAFELSPKDAFMLEGIPRGNTNTKSNAQQAASLVSSYKKFRRQRGASPAINPLRLHRISKVPSEKPNHLPFILSFDSDTLAQQFTLVEKDICSGIYWKNLLEMKLRGTFHDAKSWVEIVNSQASPHGIGVVVARFNLVVKWAVSECILTRDLNERVNCLIKLIHLASNCRKYRNFATSAQVTTALTSKVIASLKKTWVHVPVADMQTLRELENLMMPSNDFHNLRAEMEGTGADEGCIPVLGVYTNDLLLIQEKPSWIPNASTAEPLVNFEKCRTNATIIKNLIRLLEARQRYRFSPTKGIFERCLWIATLSDDEILKHRKYIQS